jgi:uncharacterized membrane protein YccF (DUF307 family)
MMRSLLDGLLEGLGMLALICLRGIIWFVMRGLSYGIGYAIAAVVVFVFYFVVTFVRILITG